MLKKPQIAGIRTLEVLDSRGNPTIQVEVATSGGAVGVGIIPSGASTGSHEALELRDEDKKRFSGKGVKKAMEAVEKKIFPLVKGMDVRKQQEIDCLMIEKDNTPNKSRFGANAILGVSLACARAGAVSTGLPLFRYLQEVYSFKKGKSMPIPMCNLINGGKHSDSRLDIQEFMVVPSGITKSFAEKMRAVSEVYGALGKILKDKGYSVAVGDEGGYAARLPRNRFALELMALAIKKAGYKVGKDINLGIDAAASEFYKRGSKKYRLEKQKKSLTSEEIVKLYKEWAKKYPMEIIEDGLAEDDWNGWKLLNKTLGDKMTLIGDDLTVTSTIRLQEAIQEKACNAVLIKVNQIGTLSETVECIRLAQAHDFKVAVSHRSGETRDHFISDLAVATGADYIKSGAPCRGERTAKYNRLIEIEKWE